MSSTVVPLSLKDAPALIERLLPVQKLSAEVYKERKAGAGQTLVSLGAYWKGRKPLVLTKACVLGCLLPATENAAEDLEVFELLMGMDDSSLAARWKRRFKPQELLSSLCIARIDDYFVSTPAGILPVSAPVDWNNPTLAHVKVAWRDDVPERDRRALEAQALPRDPYRSLVEAARRPEEVADKITIHIWRRVNRHLDTDACSITQLVEQLGIMRFGRRPRVADTFCGSGQIPFEAARLGCDVEASDLNPMACVLTWGALNLVGGGQQTVEALLQDQQEVVRCVQTEVDGLGIDSDGQGWSAKAHLYCVEARCPQTSWMVPLLPSRIISYSKRAIAALVPNPKRRRYDIVVRSGVTDPELKAAGTGTISREGKYGEAFLLHTVDGVAFKTKISTLRGDYRRSDGTIANRVRLWEQEEFRPRPDDLFQERLYCVHWMRPKEKRKGYDYEFRSVTTEDLSRERTVESFVERHLPTWQGEGWIPDMRIEVGGPPRYQGLDLVRARGWTHWHHLFPPRHLLVMGLVRKASNNGGTLVAFSRLLDYTSKLCQWTTSRAGTGSAGGGRRTGGASDNPAHVFYNQALNTLYNYGCRATLPLLQLFGSGFQASPCDGPSRVSCVSALDTSGERDLFITDPPYGDAVKYEEILDFFIAWLRRNPPVEFADWTWDSRRALAIKGEDEDFRRGMVAAYKRMAECMPDNGLQVVMFTHQSGSLWADMANIVWASGLQVTAAWYVVTETDSALRAGSHVKGTVLLVLRKRQGRHKTTRDDLAWEIQEEVEEQVEHLTGLNQQARGLYRDENVFEDADLQMAGYAAALRVLTRYSIIDGRDMTSEAIRPRVKGETTFVDGLIEFAVDTANQCLVPSGIAKSTWDKLAGPERFYLKMLDLEARGVKSLDNYQNFAKAFKVDNFRAFMGDQRANHARLKTASEFGRAEMSEGSEFHRSVLRAVLYAVMELGNDVESGEVLAHLTFNVPDYYDDMTQRDRIVELADYLAQRLDDLRPDEASAARILRELVRNQRLG